jgi:DNA polymerase/3'-5' exonuclease PolX
MSQLPTLTAMTWEVATEAAAQITAALAPHCYQVEIAGETRRKVLHGIKALDIVCQPMAYETGFFKRGLPEAIESWRPIQGHLGPGATHIAALAPVTIKGSRYLVRVELHMSGPAEFGLTLFRQTGPADFVASVLGLANQKGYKFHPGMATYQRTDPDGNRSSRPITLSDDKDVFDIAGLAFIEPENRH